MDNPYLISQQLCAMQQQEKTQSYKCTDYISTSQVVTPSLREALCKWGYQTIAACTGGATRSTVVVAISYFDRFLSTSAPMANRALSDIYYFQLAFVTCLVIALKVQAGFNVEHDFVSRVITKDMYDTEEITSMEIQILQALSWKMSGPTAHDFIDYFLEATPRMDWSYKESMKHVSKALAESAITNYTVALRYPSEVAFTAIRCAFHLNSAELVSSGSLKFLEMVSGVDPTDNAELASLFETMLCVVNELLFWGDRRATGYRQQNDDDSVSTQSSPTGVAREY